MTKTSDSWRTPQDLFDWLDKGGVYQGMELEKGFNFDIDLCAIEENSKCRYFYTNYLKNYLSTISQHHGSWPELEDVGPDTFHKKFNFSPVCFMNPPYPNPKPFIEKAWEDSKHCKIVCLVKCDPSTKWWATFWEYNKICCHSCGQIKGEGKDRLSCGEQEHYGYIYNGPKPGCEIRYFPKRIKFDPPQELIDSGVAVNVKGKWLNKLTNEYFSGPTFPCALVIMDRRVL